MTYASNYDVVSIVTPPSLKLVDQFSLIKCETEETAYKTKVADVNKDRTNEIHLATIKDCVDPTTLPALRVMAEIQNADIAEDATPEAVQDRFQAASNLDLKDLSERIESALHSVVYDANNEDPAGAVTNFILKFIAVLDQKNVLGILKDQDLAEHFIDLLVKKLRDLVLRERTKM